MTHTISSNNSTTTSHRPRLCRSDHQPNMLEYIDTTLNDSFSSRLKIQSTNATTTTMLNTTNCDQFGNTIVDQYLLYILCQKLHPNRTSDHRCEQLYQSLHQLFIGSNKISKSFFEYSPPVTTTRSNNYSSLFHHYTNFIWNEFDVEILLELACFLLKYRLRDIFPVNGSQRKILGFFTEILAIYYLATNHREYFLHSRSSDMLFPYPPSTSSSTDCSSTFHQYLHCLYENGEISLDLRQMKLLLQSDAYQFLNKKLENKKIGLVNFLDQHLRPYSTSSRSCRSLKSSCRWKIKMNIKEFPQDIQHLSLIPKVDQRLITYLIYENKYAFESFV